ncbi:hypothetical protein B0F90DRAFT_824884 [Multifurca ochricompacta]|uniref:Secreted protein n=1 Tax=Multifurca ochricompacta TaxID=376703 RepID=A0AAD4M1M3_9AGAM|nr:hypothetical protein B0F90DRAFT_824884 [Multifurca ochricompacta]
MEWHSIGTTVLTLAWASPRAMGVSPLMSLVTGASARCNLSFCRRSLTGTVGAQGGENKSSHRSRFVCQCCVLRPVPRVEIPPKSSTICLLNNLMALRNQPLTPSGGTNRSAVKTRSSILTCTAETPKLVYTALLL